MSKSTITRILKRLRETGAPVTRSPPGRPIKKRNAKVVNKVKALLKRTPCLSLKKGSEKLKIPKTTYRRIINKTLRLKTYKKQKIPKYIRNQPQRAKKGCAKIYRKLCVRNDEVVLIMDDETYVHKDPSQTKLQRYYRAEFKGKVTNENRFQPAENFSKKYMIWQAMDSNGLFSEQFIFDGIMNAELYLNECLKKRLIPFIQKNYPDRKVLFWPDLATIHYANICISYLEKEKINFVKKEDNPPNVPQVRPIEKYWAICKQRYSQRRNPAKNLSSFKRIWKNISSKVVEECGKNLAAHIKQKLRLIGRQGVFSTFK